MAHLPTGPAPGRLAQRLRSRPAQRVRGWRLGGVPRVRTHLGLELTDPRLERPVLLAQSHRFFVQRRVLLLERGELHVQYCNLRAQHRDQLRQLGIGRCAHKRIIAPSDDQSGATRPAIQVQIYLDQKGGVKQAGRLPTSQRALRMDRPITPHNNLTSYPHRGVRSSSRSVPGVPRGCQSAFRNAFAKRSAASPRSAVAILSSPLVTASLPSSVRTQVTETELACGSLVTST